MDKQTTVLSTETRMWTEASTRELLGAALKQSSELVKKELELATVELRSDLKREIAAAKVLVAAGVAALSVVNLLLMAVVLFLEEFLEGWAAALIVAGAVLVIGAITGAIGWAMRVKTPLERTQRTVKEDLQWAKERLA
jgi:hypothetical protein